MRKFVVVSINNQPKYCYYLPLIMWAWKRYGWETIVLFTEDIDYGVTFKTLTANGLWKKVNPIEGLANDTLTQVSRLYVAPFVVDDSLIMTSDADMIVLSNYFNPNPDEVTCYGRDLTDYHYPMCFVAMNKNKWCEIMDINSKDTIEDSMNFDLLERGDAFSTNKTERWVTDQNILTEKLNAYGKDRLTLVSRGLMPNGYPVGRIDRSAWHYNHGQFIDCHAPHDILTNEKSYENLLELLGRAWPNEDFKWFKDYTTEFKRLVNG